MASGANPEHGRGVEKGTGSCERATENGRLEEANL
jgi:hypothetical protein